MAVERERPGVPLLGLERGVPDFGEAPDRASGQRRPRSYEKQPAQRCHVSPPGLKALYTAKPMLQRKPINKSLAPYLQGTSPDGTPSMPSTAGRDCMAHTANNTNK
jgi:hypothetical protein